MAGGGSWLPYCAASSASRQPTDDDICVADQWQISFERRHDVRSAAGCQCKIRRGGLAVGVRLGLVKVGVAVDEQQPEARAPPQRQEPAKQNAAVAAEHDWEVACVENLADRIGKLGRVFRDAFRIEHQRLEVAAGVVGQRFDAAGPPGPQPRAQACCEQRVRQCFDPGRAKSEHRRRLDDCVAAIHGPILRLLWQCVHDQFCAVDAADAIATPARSRPGARAARETLTYQSPRPHDVGVTKSGSGRES